MTKALIYIAKLGYRVSHILQLRLQHARGQKACPKTAELHMKKFRKKGLQIKFEDFARRVTAHTVC